MTRLACFFILISCVAAQDQPGGRIQFDWDKLAAKAAEKVDVNLEGPALEMATKFLSGKGDESRVKQMVQGLRGIYVKSFTFDKEGEYSDADISAIRSQLRAPQWSNIVNVQEKHETAAIYLKMDGKQSQGIVVLAAEPKELTVVQIVGPIDLSTLAGMAGQFGIPNMTMGPKPKPTPPSAKKDD